MTPLDRLQDIRDNIALFAGKGSPFEGKLHLFQGDPRTKIALILGQNGSGKSVIRKTVGQLEREDDVEFIHLSMSGRTDSGIIRGLVYGSEGQHSTGANSARVVKTAFATSKVRDQKEGHVLFFDEPDTGLSDEAAAGVGKYIAEKTKESNDLLHGVYVVTHNTDLVRQLCVFGGMPHVLFMGDRPRVDDSAQELIHRWLNRAILPVSPEDIDDHALFIAIRDFEDKYADDKKQKLKRKP